MNALKKQIIFFYIISLPDGSIGLIIFEDRKDFLKRNFLHFVMSESNNDRNNAVI